MSKGGASSLSDFEVMPIGTVRNDRTDVQEMDTWGVVRNMITVDERFGAACLQAAKGRSAA